MFVCILRTRLINGYFFRTPGVFGNWVNGFAPVAIMIYDTCWGEQIIHWAMSIIKFYYDDMINTYVNRMNKKFLIHE